MRLLPSLTAALAWGAMFPIAAVALEHVDPFSLTAIRYAVAAAIFLALLAAIEGTRALRTGGRGRELFVLGSLGFAGFNLLSWIAYTLGARRFPDFSPLRYTALSAAYGTLTIVAVTALATLTPAADVPSVADLRAIWWHTLYIILAGAVIAVLAWNEGVRRIGPANGALFLNLVPVISFAIAIAIQGYDPNAFELTGALLTIGALVYANLAVRDQAITRPSRLAWAATRDANSAKSRP